MSQRKWIPPGSSNRETIRQQIQELTLSLAATGYKIATYGVAAVVHA